MFCYRHLSGINYFFLRVTGYDYNLDHTLTPPPPVKTCLQDFQKHKKKKKRPRKERERNPYL